MTRCRRCISVLVTLVLVLGTLGTGGGAHSAVAATRTVRLSPTSGPVGHAVTATFGGFAAGRTITIAWDGASVATAKTSVVGDGSASFVVPEAKKGGHKVTARIGTASASATFAVVPKLRISPTTVTVGRTVTATLQGYAEGELIAIRWDDTSKTLATVVASSIGSATARVVVPLATGGKHKLVGIGSSESRSQASVTVVPSIAVNPRSGPNGTNVRVTLRGFGKGEYVEFQLRAGGGTLAQGFTTASVTGSANVTITISVPEEIGPGHYAIVARGYGVSVTETPFDLT
jgi:hypothetical protein